MAVLVVLTACNEDKSPTKPDDPEPENPQTVFTLNGHVYESGSGLVDVSMHLDGAKKDTTVITDATGHYVFTDVPDGIYTLTPSKGDYIFTPKNLVFTVSNANMPIQSFTGAGPATPIPHDINGVSFVSIPGGKFLMGDEEGKWNFALPVHSVTVSDFEVGIFEVTNSLYCAYLNAALKNGDVEVKDGDVYGRTGVWKGERYLDIGFGYGGANTCWITFDANVFSVVSGKENWPVVTVTWYGAKSFALYYGFDLPTEAEWEYAARGGRQYKHGTHDGALYITKANYDQNINHPVDVGCYPPNPFGLYDMSGNLFEWCHDWYGSYSLESSVNPSGPDTGTCRVCRGGSYEYIYYYCRSAYRGDYYYPNLVNVTVGFRVVRRISPSYY